MDLHLFRFFFFPFMFASYTSDLLKLLRYLLCLLLAAVGNFTFRPPPFCHVRGPAFPGSFLVAPRVYKTFRSQHF